MPFALWIEMFHIINMQSDDSPAADVIAVAEETVSEDALYGYGISYSDTVSIDAENQALVIDLTGDETVTLEGTTVVKDVTVYPRGHNLTINGNGKLTVSGGSFIIDGFSGGGSVTFDGGEININMPEGSPSDDAGLKVDNHVKTIFKSGTVRINNSYFYYPGGSEDSDEENVLVQGGTLEINSGKNLVAMDLETNMRISSGTVTITADEYDGMSVKNNLTITGGSLNVKAGGIAVYANGAYSESGGGFQLLISGGQIHLSGPKILSFGSSFKKVIISGGSTTLDIRLPFIDEFNVSGGTVRVQKLLEYAESIRLSGGDIYFAENPVAYSFILVPPMAVLNASGYRAGEIVESVSYVSYDNRKVYQIGGWNEGDFWHIGKSDLAVNNRGFNEGKPNQFHPEIDDSQVAPDFTGFHQFGGEKAWWYENGIRQGTLYDPQGILGDNNVVRGREIADNTPGAPKDENGNSLWYWLDADADGARAVNKEVWIPYVYNGEEHWSEEDILREAEKSGDMAEQVIEAIRAHGKVDSEGNAVPQWGKWVRYDAQGGMIKGWYTVEGDEELIYPNQVGNTYYYDFQTGLMAKGWVTIDGVLYHFDETYGFLDVGTRP